MADVVRERGCAAVREATTAAKYFQKVSLTIKSNPPLNY
jgi:hypothetical protein